MLIFDLFMAPNFLFFKKFWCTNTTFFGAHLNSWRCCSILFFLGMRLGGAGCDVQNHRNTPKLVGWQLAFWRWLESRKLQCSFFEVPDFQQYPKNMNPKLQNLVKGRFPISSYFDIILHLVMLDILWTCCINVVRFEATGWAQPKHLGWPREAEIADGLWSWGQFLSLEHMDTACDAGNPVASILLEIYLVILNLV